MNFAALWHKVKNVEEPSLYPASCSPSSLISVEHRECKACQRNKQPPPHQNPTFMILWQGVGSSHFGNEITHVHAGLRTHFDQEPETMQMPHHSRLKLNRIRTKPEAF